MSSHTYHLQELSIAVDLDDPRRVMPPIEKGHQRILDVGCGAGQTLIASNIDSQAMAVGVDNDHAPLSLGRRMSSSIEFVCSEGEALPFKDECFDLVISRVALPYMHVQSAISEMSRVLKGGGDLWITLHPPRMIMRETLNDIIRLKYKGALYRVYVLINGMTLHLVNKQFPLPLRSRRYESFQTGSGIRRILQGTGFDSVKIRNDKFMVVTAKKKDQRSSVLPVQRASLVER